MTTFAKEGAKEATRIYQPTDAERNINLLHGATKKAILLFLSSSHHHPADWSWGKHKGGTWGAILVVLELKAKMERGAETFFFIAVC